MASDPSRKRAMVDTTILVAGSCWPRWPYELTVLLSGTFLREVLGWSSERLESIRHRSWKDLEL